MRHALFLLALLTAACSQETAKTADASSQAPASAPTAASNATPSDAPAALEIDSRAPALLGALTIEDYRQSLAAAAAQDFRQAYGPCAEIGEIRGVRLDPYRRLADPHDPMATSLGEGVDQVWREKVLVRGCGRESVRNLMIMREPADPAPTIGATLPGDTRVTYGVAHAMRAQLASIAAAGAANCTAPDARVHVVETRITTQPRPATSWTSPWTEQWTLNYCGQFVRADMAFTPTPATGGIPLRRATYTPWVRWRARKASLTGAEATDSRGFTPSPPRSVRRSVAGRRCRRGCRGHVRRGAGRRSVG